MPSFIEHLSHTTRSFRRFRESYPVTEALMTQWVDNARQTASAANRQPLRYRIITAAIPASRSSTPWPGRATSPTGKAPKKESAPPATS